MLNVEKVTKLKKLSKQAPRPLKFTMMDLVTGSVLCSFVTILNGMIGEEFKMGLNLWSTPNSADLTYIAYKGDYCMIQQRHERGRRQG